MKYITHGIPTNTARKLQGRDYARELVRTRDNYTCQSCGKKWKEGQRRFDIHHLDNLCGKLSKKADSVKNLNRLITLCHKCHFNHPEHAMNANNTYLPLRNAEIKQLFSSGLTRSELATKYNLSFERIRQIIVLDK